jgi:hypothetical protein
MTVEMTAHGWQHRMGIDTDNETELQPRPGAWRDGVHRRFWIAGSAGEHLQRTPAEDTLRRGQARLAPPVIDRWTVRPAVDLTIGKRVAHGLRDF